MTAFDEKCNAINRQHQLQADYEKTLALLHALKAGEVTLDQVTMRADGWLFNALPPSPLTPPAADAAAVPESIKERIAGNGELAKGIDNEST